MSGVLLLSSPHLDRVLEPPTATIACRFGRWGSIVTGVARFDEVVLTPLVR